MRLGGDSSKGTVAAREGDKRRRIRILVVDDEVLLRSLLARFIDLQDDFLLVGEAGDGLEAIRAVAQCAPDVVLMDLVMPRLTGDLATRRILQEHPEVRVVGLSGWSEAHLVVRMKEAGACGFLLKACSPERIESAIRVVAKGGTYFAFDARSSSRGDAPGLAWRGGPREPPGVLDLSQRGQGELTPREQEIVQCVAEGQTSREIAARLGITERTVSKYRELIMKKLGLHSVAGVTKYAVRNQMTPPR